MEKIIIKNFGPIKDVELEIKDINVFIGSTSSGKSTVAKLIAFFNEIPPNSTYNIGLLEDRLAHYNINFGIKPNTFIRYSGDKFFWQLEEKKIDSNYPSHGIRVRELKSKWKTTSEILIGNVIDEQMKIDIIGSLLLLADLKFFVKDYEWINNPKVKKALSIVERYKKNDHKSGDKDIREVLEAMDNLFETLSKNLYFSTILYIPAERILLSMIAESIHGFINNAIAIAKCIHDFGAQFELARKKIDKFSISFLDVEYSYSEKSNFVTFDDGAKVKLEQASSGLQSIIPLLLIIEANTTDESTNENYFIVEEPELNLYPTVQKELIEFIVERINKHQDKLIITTHSPYVLTSLDNLIQASNAAKASPEQKEKVAEIMPEEKWVDFDRIACYYFEDGCCRSTLDTENQTIGASNIDDVSEELGKTFDQLLELKYAHVS